MIFGFENWQKHYIQSGNTKSIWIVVQTSNEDDIYLETYQDWLDFKNYFATQDNKIKNIGLQYKSHLIKTYAGNADAVYVIRSVKGQMGGTSRDCYTIGIVKGDKVHKTMWLTPELVEDSSYVDTLENCFEEALVYNDRQNTKTGTI